ncbi:calcium-binding protein [Microvirga sp. 2MCAF38]|uniref:calcium-binding protein n=1 Tax=Microvirga sp. 2MCAF38 TaxID=3232989 RepID=UPI003F9A8F8E
MTIFTFTIDDPKGVDLSFFFPGNLSLRAQVSGYNLATGTGYTEYDWINDGVIDTSRTYNIGVKGKDFAFPSGLGGLIATITSATLSERTFGGGGSLHQLASLSITNNSGAADEIRIAALRDLTPDVLLHSFPGDSKNSRIILEGNDGNDTLPGSQWGDTLDGGKGHDKLIGRGGSDTYIVDSQSDIIVELDGEGTDTAIAKISYRLADNVSVENLIADSGEGLINLTGNNIANRVAGNDADNRLDGGGGADTLGGGKGNDTYLVDNALDIVNESAGQGTDTVLASVSYALKAGSSVEFLRATDPSAKTAINLTGNELDNALFGNAGANKLAGGSGKDAFAFASKLGGKNVDKITDFNVKDDLIWLENAVFKTLGKSGSLAKPAKLKTDAFWTGAQAHDASDRIIYNKSNGALYYDPDGTGPVAQIKFAQLTKNLKITAADFFVI